jgi:hypothetical protein
MLATRRLLYEPCHLQIASLFALLTKVLLWLVLQEKGLSIYGMLNVATSYCPWTMEVSLQNILGILLKGMTEGSKVHALVVH